ncbi:MAG: Lipoprotein-releasing system transmembrane protein LolC [Candidatus Moanabacter tarae]|uniref:Lipoprotein-releasing system transmembrane protein LolC n=1 Tax=Candidatus Moanibacter tarae TaxID=2200854 RepID=A0A2Z4AF87_9BACT|nr:MAG: Lipoprotein-releasing system transmembrane protein LolC [Candidatus Moanabacter tarae]|tara:strand:- start:106331 stop:107530 length:1200 start_codon:yes stop_codon:yes gene_type:complete
MLMSLTGVIVGVSLFILAQAHTSGFERLFIESIWGTNGVIRISDKLQDTLRSMSVDSSPGEAGGFYYAHRKSKNYVHGITNSEQVIDAVRQFRNVSGISPVLRGTVDLISGGSSRPVDVYGIDLERHLMVSDLEDQIISGSLKRFRESPTGFLAGSLVASRLGIETGDTAIAWSLGKNYRFRLSGIFETGISQLDATRIFLHIDQARNVLKRPHGASFLQVNLFDKERAPEDAYRMERVLRHIVASWQERERSSLEVFRALKISSALTVSTIIIISGLGMFNTLAIIVMEKRREIAILRSIGYTRTDVSLIFLIQGGIILAVGIVVGCICGSILTFLASKIPINIQGVFTVDHIVVHWSFYHYIAAIITATVVVLVASYFPSQKAARIEPAGIIRETSG